MKHFGPPKFLGWLCHWGGQKDYLRGPKVVKFLFSNFETKRKTFF